MLNIWFTADFHLGHKNIIRYCNRPFDTVEEMNRTILDRLNNLVKANDILYFLGDFCIGPKARAVELRREIRCKKEFAVPGKRTPRNVPRVVRHRSEIPEIGTVGQLANSGAISNLKVTPKQRLSDFHLGLLTEGPAGKRRLRRRPSTAGGKSSAD